MSKTPITHASLLAAGAAFYENDQYTEYVFGNCDPCHPPIMYGQFNGRKVISVILNPTNYRKTDPSLAHGSVWVINELSKFRFAGVKTIEQLKLLCGLYLPEYSEQNPTGTPITYETVLAAGLKREERFGQDNLFIYRMLEESGSGWHGVGKYLSCLLDTPNCSVPDGIKGGVMIGEGYTGIIHFPLVTTIEQLLKLFCLYTGKNFDPEGIEDVIIK
jgi:hypothetical protein